MSRRIAIGTGVGAMAGLVGAVVAWAWSAEMMEGFVTPGWVLLVVFRGLWYVVVGAVLGAGVVYLAKR